MRPAPRHTRKRKTFAAPRPPPPRGPPRPEAARRDNPDGSDPDDRDDPDDDRHDDVGYGATGVFHQHEAGYANDVNGVSIPAAGLGGAQQRLKGQVDGPGCHAVRAAPP